MSLAVYSLIFSLLGVPFVAPRPARQRVDHDRVRELERELDIGS